MSDTTLNQFVASGTNAERLAYTPSPPTVAAGPDSGYFFYETDTGDTYSWDGSAWQIVGSGGGSGTVTNTGTLTNHALIKGNGGVDVSPLASLGTTTTVLHGNAAGDPTFAAVSLTADVTGTLPLANGGTGTTTGETGRLLGIQVITTTGAGTYTPTSGTTSIVMQLQGGGGGGGGATTGTAGQASLAQSGAGGGWLQKRLTSAFSGAGYSVGAKGSKGAAGNNNGNAGGDTTFTATGGGGTVYTASGGGGGAGAPANNKTPPAHIPCNTTPGTGTNGDINISGGIGVPGVALSTADVFGTKGGDSMFGRSGGFARTVTANSSSAGVDATGKGAGGSGAVVLGTGASVAGGDGSDGMIVIYEYS